jgi:peptide/nickel transport system permease protein
MRQEISSKLPTSKKWENVRRGWYNFSRNNLSVLGLVIVLIIILIAILAPVISPHPESAGRHVDFEAAKQSPNAKYWFGTDIFGRDILTRTMFAFRYSLFMAIIVITMATPIGVALGLVAGYYQGTKIDTIIMRMTDIFLAVPPLMLAMAICAVLVPSLSNTIIAIGAIWWTWYTRMVYSMVTSLRGEFFVYAADLTGASKLHILFREILPNCLSEILTKMTLDVGAVVMIGSSLSFVGLGAQPPTSDLGNMIANGTQYLPDQWWMAVFPGVSLMIAVMAFNLLGDGIRDMYQVEEA